VGVSTVLQTKRTWANTQRKLLKATLRREFTLIQRIFFIYIFRSTQVPSCFGAAGLPHILFLSVPLRVCSATLLLGGAMQMTQALACLVQVAFNAIVSSTLFLRTRLHPNNIDDANLYLAVTFFTLTSML
jgi:hypothetical protein